MKSAKSAKNAKNAKSAKKTGKPSPAGKNKKTRDHSLRRLNVKRGFLSFFRLLTLALFLYAAYLYSLRQTESAVVVAAVGLLSVLLTVLPAKKIYQEQWYLDKVRVSLGEYAEEIDLTRKIATEPDYFRMLCLFPTGRDDSEFSFSNRVTARCRGRKLTMTDATVPLRDGDLLYGCLIQLEMPRAPLSRFRMIGSTIASEEELTPFFRRQHKLLKAEAPWIQDMAVYCDQPLSPQEQDRLNGLLQGAGEDLAVAIEGRMMYCFAAGRSTIVPPRKMPGLIRRDMLLPLTVPQLPKWLDYAFDTENLRSGAETTEFDEVSDRKMAGVQGEIVRPRRIEDKPAPVPAPEAEKPPLPAGALETDRLILRPVRLEDADRIYECWAKDPQVTEYLTWGPHPDAGVTRQLVDLWVKAYRDPGTVRYGIALKDGEEAGQLIGMIDVTAWHSGVPELGYVLGRDYWSQGYMTEAVTAVTEYLFRRGCPSVLIEAHTENVPSNIVAEKCGFAFIGSQQKQCSPMKPWMVTVNWYRKDADARSLRAGRSFDQ